MIDLDDGNEPTEPTSERRRKPYPAAEIAFILKRAFRSRERRVGRSDVVAAFGVSPNRASQLLGIALRNHSDLLVRKGYSVFLRPGAVAPADAGEAELFESIQARRDSFADLGLTAQELPLTRVEWTNDLGDSPGVFAKVIDAIVGERMVDICYVSMRAGDFGVWRRITPLSLDSIAGQWRIHAQDMDKEGYPERSFVVVRIIDAKDCLAKAPKDYKRASSKGSKTAVSLKVDPHLTKQQIQSLLAELNLRPNKSDGLLTLEINTRALHDFLIRYAGGATSTDAIWPPVSVNKED